MKQLAASWISRARNEREANTIGSKSSDAVIAHMILGWKKSWKNSGTAAELNSTEWICEELVAVVQQIHLRLDHQL